MKEHPILFSGPMARAILGGRKTQTRRVVKNPPPHWLVHDDGDIAGAWAGNVLIESHGWKMPSPYGIPGDRLWVRETWAKAGEVGDETEYRADNPDPLAGKWRPSIHMPRWASRITLEVTAVRIERLRDISGRDAVREGCRGPDFADLARDPVEEFSDLWDSINSKRGFTWADNPWVWVVSFRVAKGAKE